MSRHRNKPTDRGALTSWRGERERVFKTRKGTDRLRRTHILETASGGTCQYTKRNQPIEVHSLPGDGRERHLSGHGKKPTDRGALTVWRGHGEGLVGTQKETDRPRCTHNLETAWGGTCQDTERNRPSEAHSQAGDGIGRDLSGHRKKIDRARCTHNLETASGGTCQDTERNRPSEAYSQTGDGIGRNLSEHGKKQTERGPLTLWRQQESLVRTQKETDRPKSTHSLETASGGTCQDTERN